MDNTKRKRVLRLRRKRRIRKKLSGSEKSPRLSIFRSARHIYAQVINDEKGETLASISSFGKNPLNKRAGKEECKELGKKLAEICKEKDVTKVVFDRNGYVFHGRVKEFAEGLKEGGVKI